MNLAAMVYCLITKRKPWAITHVECEPQFVLGLQYVQPKHRSALGAHVPFSVQGKDQTGLTSILYIILVQIAISSYHEYASSGIQRLRPYLLQLDRLLIRLPCTAGISRTPADKQVASSGNDFHHSLHHRPCRKLQNPLKQVRRGSWDLGTPANQAPLQRSSSSSSTTTSFAASVCGNL